MSSGQKQRLMKNYLRYNPTINKASVTKKAKTHFMISTLVLAKSSLVANLGICSSNFSFMVARTKETNSSASFSPNFFLSALNSCMSVITLKTLFVQMYIQK